MAEKMSRVHMKSFKSVRVTQGLGLGGWLTILVVISVFIFAGIDVSYRHSLPTDGWAIGEAGDVTFLRDVAGLNPEIQPGDVLVSIDGIPADYQLFRESDALRARWQVGNSLTYRIRRDGAAFDLLVTLGNWPTGRDFWGSFMDLVTIIGLLTSFIQLGFAAFIFFRKPGDPAAGSLLLILAIFTGAIVSATIPFAYTSWFDPGAILLQQRMSWFFLLGLFPFAILRFAMTFPSPKPSYRRYPWLPFVVGGIGSAMFLLIPDSPLSWFWFLFSFLAAVGILVHSAFTMRDAVSRAQIRWGIGGVLIGFGTLAIMFLLNTVQLVVIPGSVFDMVMSAVFMVMVVMISIAILRYRLFDIDVIIRKTLQYALLTGLLVLVYFGSVILLQSLTENLFGEQSPLVIVLSTLAIAALFNPLRIRIQDFIDRRFYRKKYDAEQALAQFAATARDEVDMDKLTVALLDVVQETMQSESLSLWLKQEESKRL
jgi:hypothetical protein